MYFLLGAQGVVKTLLLLSRKHLPEAAGPRELRQAYLKFLDELQPAVPHFLDRGESIQFVVDSENVAKLTIPFNVQSRLNDIHSSFIPAEQDAAHNERTLREAHATIDWIRNSNPGYYDAFSVVIRSIFAAQSKVAAGGSCSNAVGVIWANHKKAWSTQDFVEFFVHETAHSCLFLDEYRYTHYKDLSLAITPEYFATSAILKRSRPLDKVLHSLVVGTEVLLARENWLGHPHTAKLHASSEDLIAGSLEAVSSIRSATKAWGLLTERGRELVDLCNARIETVAHRLATAAGQASVLSSRQDQVSS